MGALVGVVIGVLCAVGIYWLFSNIGTGITLTSATRKEHRLVTHGPYRWIRHPLYTFGSALFISLGMIADNWFIGLLGLLAFIPVAIRTPKEEANLIEKFGDEYREYMKHTGRFFPKLGVAHEIGLRALLLLIILLLPKYGLLALYRDWRSAWQRELVEDALKHLLDREQQGRHASPESLAGTLSLPRLKATRLITDMESQNLLETRGAEIHLTAEGERWAMHIVRAHRLWERYLADEARMPLSQIHNEAQRREHSFTDAQLDELSAALGHPTRDRTATDRREEDSLCRDHARYSVAKRCSRASCTSR
jgi:Mn-dependent DtxR family transcriptional regulator